MIVGARAKNEGQGQRSNRYKVSEVNIISRPKGYMRNKRPKKEERQERIEYEESLQHMAEEEGEEGRKEGGRGELPILQACSAPVPAPAPAPTTAGVLASCRPFLLVKVATAGLAPHLTLDLPFDDAVEDGIDNSLLRERGKERRRGREDQDRVVERSREGCT
jgi:hypothetical protein